MTIATVKQVKIPLQSWEPWVDPGERFKHIELEINTACDLACFGCDRLSDVTTDRNMTVEQVELFVQESLNLNWGWERIRLLGGEPTLHPQFVEMVNLLRAYRDQFPHVFLQVLTNGKGKSHQYREWLESERISLHAEVKDGTTPPWFNNTRIVPLDRDPTVRELPPCVIFGIRGCGIGLTRHGYFLDGAGASAARVAGLDVGVMHLKDVTWDAMMEQAKVLCRICGHWNPTDATKDNLLSELISKTGEVTGPFWTEKLAAWKANPPKLRIYGES
jgi:hypothetical protein